jgi:NAD-dependent deacetylase
MNITASQQIQETANVLSKASYVTCLVGAGLSAESGIPTYRGPGGLWTRFGEPPMNDYDRFVQNPTAYWEERLSPPSDGPRAELFKALEKAEPNAGHYALAELENMGVLQFTVTQNIDGLGRVAGSENVVEIHGSRNMVRCTVCGLRLHRDDFTVAELPPSCPECGELVKIDTVLFGEPIPAKWLAHSYEQIEASDCILLVGTSGTVNPSASFPLLIKQHGGHLLEFNPLESHLSPYCDIIVRESAAESLPALVKLLHSQ